MPRSRIAIALLSLVVFALVVAGCGGGSSSSSTSTASESSENSASSGGGTVSATEISGLGPVLVDSEEMTVYMFAKDQGTTSCYGACEEGWPPVIAEGKPTAGEGAMSSQLGTTKRKDGTMQVTYAGHPLYTFAGDTAPGEANGNESTAFGGKWSVMSESGEAVAGTATSGGSAEAPEEENSESSSGGYGY